MHPLSCGEVETDRRLGIAIIVLAQLSADFAVDSNCNGACSLHESQSIREVQGETTACKATNRLWLQQRHVGRDGHERQSAARSRDNILS
jgi:hypothetical protein